MRVCTRRSDLVATGRPPAVVGHSAVGRLGPRVAAVPVTGLPPAEVLPARPADAHGPCVADLLDLVPRDT
ncbi:hypothetical protein [Streptomyces albogriseolus]|uniref:hypothetical protein n=1 Tax=Streptomyces albogriseolus TaxID=1887 RepID=UPI0033B3D6D4